MLHISTLWSGQPCSEIKGIGPKIDDSLERKHARIERFTSLSCVFFSLKITSPIAFIEQIWYESISTT